MLTLSTEADLSMQAARARLGAPPRREAVMPALGAAALAAMSALALAGAVILGPPGHGRLAPAPVAGAPS